MRGERRETREEKAERGSAHGVGLHVMGGMLGAMARLKK